MVYGIPVRTAADLHDDHGGRLQVRTRRRGRRADHLGQLQDVRPRAADARHRHGDARDRLSALSRTHAPTATIPCSLASKFVASCRCKVARRIAGPFGESGMSLG